MTDCMSGPLSLC